MALSTKILNSAELFAQDRYVHHRPIRTQSDTGFFVRRLWGIKCGQGMINHIVDPPILRFLPLCEAEKPQAAKP